MTDTETHDTNAAKVTTLEQAETVTPEAAAGPKTVSAPVLAPAASLQLIDGDQNFTEDVDKYMDVEWGLVDCGFDYNVVAVFGSQSTGKSTLLNKLFGTNFATMNENSRQQTTKGIWMSKGVDMDVLVMDVEGTDGRERGENQDFERKSALFSLATAEVLIVNLWENMVGLYNGANMGLLKTVFEVNLQLFQKKGKEKTLLFFVIRDHIGVTPLENLARTLRTDLERIWSELSKPEGLADCQFTDFFDCDFTALPHKILLPEKFDEAALALRQRFADKNHPGYVFKPRYHKRIPADGFSHYAANIWDKIVNNRDLDLPTQQELLAQFRCDEILNSAFDTFSKALKPFQRPTEAGKVVDELGDEMRQHFETALRNFDKNASRYHKQVYKRKREELTTKCHSLMHILFLGQLKNLQKRAVQQFTAQLQDQLAGTSYDFLAVVTSARDQVLSAFIQGAQALLVEGTDWSFADAQEQLEDELSDISAKRRTEEVSKMIGTYEKLIVREVDELVALHLNEAKPNMWQLLLDAYQKIEGDAEHKLVDRAQRFGSGEEEQKDCIVKLRRHGWEALIKKIRDELVDNMVMVKLRNRLEEKFRYDQHGIPRVWKPDDDMDGHFQRARDDAFKLLPLYAHIDWSKSSLDLEEHFANDRDFDYADTLTIYSGSKQQELNTRFRREAEALFLEAKRSVVATETKVPYWMIVLLCVLGWDEFLTILTSPMYLVLCSVLGFVGYIIWVLGLAGPVETVARTVVNQGMEFAKARLAEAVIGNKANAIKASEDQGEAVPLQTMRASTI